MQFHQIQNRKQTNHLKWLGAIFFSWGTFVFALFFATFVGSMARQAGASKLLQQGIQAGLVTFITVPLLYILLKRTSSRPFCSIGLSGWRRSHSESHYGSTVCDFSFWNWVYYRPFIRLDNHYTISLLRTFGYSIALKYDHRILL
ncbi:hypothetical protein MOB26_15890 [Bacillus vallismortis]|nr:hypothetical protein [Bacillus vallismortis]